MMNADGHNGLSAQVAAALDWWRDAGVDCIFEDAPRNWIPAEQADEAQVLGSGTAIASTPPAAAAVPAATIGGDRSTWPANLASFGEWWLTEPSLDGGQLAGRVPPRGSAGSELMVLVAEPEADDAELLLAGPQGRLLNAMLAAMGIAPEAAYLASALPRHTPLADWAAMQADGLGEVLAHHIALAAPRRLLVFGGNVLPLLGNDLPNKPDVLPGFNHEGGSIPLFAARDLATLLGKPRLKAGFWQRWLDWAA